MVWAKAENEIARTGSGSDAHQEGIVDDRDFNPELFGQQGQVVVFGTGDTSEAIVVKGMLEANGLEVTMSSSHGVSHGQLGYVDLMVPADQAAVARELLAEYEGETPDIEEEEEW
jgi:hypothetical protein